MATIRRFLNCHSVFFMILLVVIINIGSALWLTLGKIPFTINEDTRTVVFTFSDTAIPDKVEIKPEQLQKIRALDFGDALYFCVVTFTTIGYGDIAPVSWPGRIFVMWLGASSMLIMLVGIPVVVAKLIKREEKHGS